MAPKEKHVVTLKQAVEYGLSRNPAILDYVMRQICKRIQRAGLDWIVMLKILVLVHRLFRETTPTFQHALSDFMARTGQLAVLDRHTFRDASSGDAQVHSSFIRVYSEYLTERLFLYRELGLDVFVEAQDETKPILAPPRAEAATNADSPLPEIPLERVLAKMPQVQLCLSKLLNVVPEVLARSSPPVLFCLPKCHSEAKVLYRIICEGIIVVCDHFYALDLPQARQALTLYENTMNLQANFAEYCEWMNKVPGASRQVMAAKVDPLPTHVHKEMEEHVRALANGTAQPTPATTTAADDQNKSSTTTPTGAVPPPQVTGVVPPQLTGAAPPVSLGHAALAGPTGAVGPAPGSTVAQDSPLEAAVETPTDADFLSGDADPFGDDAPASPPAPTGPAKAWDHLLNDLADASPGSPAGQAGQTPPMYGQPPPPGQQQQQLLLGSPPGYGGQPTGYGGQPTGQQYPTGYPPSPGQHVEGYNPQVTGYGAGSVVPYGSPPGGGAPATGGLTGSNPYAAAAAAHHQQQQQQQQPMNQNPYAVGATATGGPTGSNPYAAAPPPSSQATGVLPTGVPNYSNPYASASGAMPTGGSGPTGSSGALTVYQPVQTPAFQDLTPIPENPFLSEHAVAPAPTPLTPLPGRSVGVGKSTGTPEKRAEAGIVNPLDNMLVDIGAVAPKKKEDAVAAAMRPGSNRFGLSPEEKAARAAAAASAIVMYTGPQGAGATATPSSSSGAMGMGMGMTGGGGYPSMMGAGGGHPGYPPQGYPGGGYPGYPPQGYYHHPGYGGYPGYPPPAQYTGMPPQGYYPPQPQVPGMMPTGYGGYAHQPGVPGAYGQPNPYAGYPGAGGGYPGYPPR